MYHDIDCSTIDIIGERKDGGIELHILIDDIFDSEEFQTKLLDKIQNYISYAIGKDFEADFPNADKNKTVIVLKVKEQLSDDKKDWIKSIEDWVVGNKLGFNLVNVS